MIDVNDLKRLDTVKARDNLIDTYNSGDWGAYNDLLVFILQVEALQRKYTKPIAALLEKD